VLIPQLAHPSLRPDRILASVGRRRAPAQVLAPGSIYPFTSQSEAVARTRLHLAFNLPSWLLAAGSI